MSLKAWQRLLVGLCAGIVWAAGPTPVQAECIELDVAIHYTDEPDYYVIGPDHCVTDTPWNQTDSVWFDDDSTGTPPGSPNGVYFEVWFTSP